MSEWATIMIKSAKRTIGNSPAINRWEEVINKNSKSAERTTGFLHIISNSEHLSPASRAKKIKLPWSGGGVLRTYARLLSVTATP